LTRPIVAGESFERGGDEMPDPGLFVSLASWGWHVLGFDHRKGLGDG